MSELRDVVVIGAGPGGSSAAHYLASQGLDVLLLDKFDFPRDKTCGDGLTPLALRNLDRLGLLEPLQAVSWRANRMDFFAPNGRTVTLPFPTDSGAVGYSLVVPRMLLDNLVRERAILRGADFRGRLRVTEVVADEHGVTVRGECKGGTVLARARVAIIATGASPTLLLRMGLLRRPPRMMLAARAYFEGMVGLADRVQFRFDGVPLPGYGWVFPLSDSSANVGAGFLPGGPFARRQPETARAAFDQFVQSPSMRKILEDARRVGPVKGYPIRADFVTAPTYGERVLLVGEAAGLVNPLTGDGVDYALETGRLAADHILPMFAAGDFSPPRFAAYDRTLRNRFHPMFVFCERARTALLHPTLLNQLARLVERHPELGLWLANVVLGNREPAIPVRRLVHVALNKGR